MGLTKNSSNIQIYKGEDRELSINLKPRGLCEPFDLTGVTEITARFPKEDGSILALTMTDNEVEVVSEVKGQIIIKLSQVNTLDLKAGKRLDLELYIDIDSTRRIVRFSGVLDVYRSLS